MGTRILYGLGYTCTKSKNLFLTESETRPKSRQNNFHRLKINIYQL